MAKTLLIGLGGTGSRVVNNVVKTLNDRGETINNGDIFCAVLDSNVSDNELLVNSGTGVPVIATSKAKKIQDYFDDYSYLKMEEWCPSSPSFLQSTMIDGCSELRIKSRIAFMDCLETRTLGELEDQMAIVLKKTVGDKIRIMVVSSLAGGTGSGMFIQVALWLRKYFDKADITIRGIFLLPDIFIDTLDDVRNNKSTVMRHYANAYAAIRELNAITKIRLGNFIDLEYPIRIDNLFDSEKDADCGKPLFDFAFFVDSEDERGVKLSSAKEYEQMAAQLIYMQLYAPMATPMYSEEDNTFLRFIACNEPMYGSCGTSKAEYPAPSVKIYCMLRAMQDSLTGGWKCIDDEIKELEDKIKEDESHGVFTNEGFDKRRKYIDIFDENAAVKKEELAGNRFFYGIAKDIKNEKKSTSSDGKVSTVYTDKVKDYIKLITDWKIDVAVQKHKGTDDFALNKEVFVKAKHTEAALIKRKKDDDEGLENVLKTFDSKVEEYADAIINSIMPYSMGNVKADNKYLVYSLFSKVDDKGERLFVHPVAARYMLYKLVLSLEKELKSIDLQNLRADAINGGDMAKAFDNPNTKNQLETTPEAFFASRKWYQNEDEHIDVYEGLYADYILNKIALCEKYEKNRLLVVVYQKLIQRLNKLIKKMESFFEKLGDTQKKIASDIAANLEEAKEIVGKTIYIYSGEKAKEQVYQSLDLDVLGSDSVVNESVVRAVYGTFCADERPKIEENKVYCDMDVSISFLIGMRKGVVAKLNTKANRNKINLDIYTALCKQSDLEMTELKDKEAEDLFAEHNVLDDFDVATGEIKETKNENARYRKRFVMLKNLLWQNATPFLKHTKEEADEEFGTRTARPKTFWGFHPGIISVFPDIGRILGINEDTQSNESYRANELYCYRAVYGMEAKYIPKFNELTGGNYFRNYAHEIKTMMEDVQGVYGARAYVRTPHLDKTWHKILPYVTDDKQNQEYDRFFKGLWLAIAYGKLKTNDSGKLVIRRQIDNGHGRTVAKDVELTLGGKSLGKVDVMKYITALKTDGVFAESDIPCLETLYAEDLADMENYVDTDVYKGLTKSKDELNPIDVIVRYYETPGSDVAITDAMIRALENIAGDLVESYGIDRSDDKKDAVKFGKICRGIYNSSTRVKDKDVVFEAWVEKFSKYKV